MGTVDGKPVLAANRVGGSLLDPIRPSRLDTVTIEELLNTQLHKPDNSLVFLPEQSLALALEDYIVKNIPSAIEDFVDGVLEETQRELEKQRTTKSKEEIMEAVEKKKDKMNAAHLVDREESKQLDIAGPSQRSQTQTQPTQGRRRSDSLDDDGDLGVDVSPPKKARGKGSTAATGRFGTPRGKAAAASKPNASKPKTTSRDFDDEEEDDDDYDQRRPVARSKKPAATTPPTRKVSARAASARGRARQRELFSDEDNGDDNDGDEDFEIGDEHEDESEHVADVVTARRGKAPAKKVPAKSLPKKPAGLKRLRKAASDESDAGLDEFDHRQRPTTSSRSRATVAASASDEIDLCSSGSESSKAPPKKSIKTTRVKPTPQPKITALFQKQQEKAKARHDDDDIESDPEFSQLTGTTTTTVNSRPRAVDATNEETASELPPSQSQFLSQFQSQLSTAAKKRKLPLSMLAASQSAPAVKQTKGDDGGTSTLRKGYGRARR